jgi:hypothetical protein
MLFVFVMNGLACCFDKVVSLRAENRGDFAADSENDIISVETGSGDRKPL